MQRLLLYVHYNKFNFISGHVLYQLENIRPLYSRVVFISNSQLPEDVKDHLSSQQLVDDILERQNSGFDFAAWRGGMKTVGVDQLAHFDSVTLMNDTCFGPLWDLESIYQQFEHDEEVDFWGMTNYRKDKDFNEHIQSYYLSFKKQVLTSSAFHEFWQGVQDFTNVQDVIDNYETKVTTNFLDAGFRYKLSLIPSMKIQLGCSIQTFLITILQRFSNIRFLSSKLKPLQTMKESCLIFLMN